MKLIYWTLYIICISSVSTMFLGLWLPDHYQVLGDLSSIALWRVFIGLFVGFVSFVGLPALRHKADKKTKPNLKNYILKEKK